MVGAYLEGHAQPWSGCAEAWPGVLRRMDGRAAVRGFRRGYGRSSAVSYPPRQLEPAPELVVTILLFSAILAVSRLRGAVTQPSEKEDSPKRGYLVQLAKYSQLAYVLPAATVAGWLVGAGLDRWLHTTWLYMVGLFLGIVAGFVDLIRTVTSKDAK